MNLISQGFRAAMNHLLGQAGWARNRLCGYSGSTLCLSADPVQLFYTLDDDGLLADAGSAIERADVTISVPLGQLPLFVTGGLDSLMNAVRIEGHAELAETLGFVFRNLEWDVEEDISRLVGDIPAHRITGSARELRRAHDHALRSLAGNLAEYLVDEERLLITRQALSDLTRDVAQLRDHIARLTKRTERLDRLRKRPPG
ncbi:MAG TPA: hypothetical protein PKZ27_04750 [Rhodocyclaceae bacterium]|nr:hypothetical protein [Rhodocyclaceae bacterium]